MGITYGTSTLFQATKGIVQDGLVLNLDAGVNKSYPRNGTTWYDLSNNGNGTLTNGPTFDRGNGGNIILDATNDAITISDLTFSSAGFTYSFTAKFGSSPSVPYPRIIAGDVDIEWHTLGPHKLRWRWAGGSPSALDSNSNYFIQYLDGFYPDRVYKILLKLKYDDGQEQIFDDDFEFIVKRK